MDGTGDWEEIICGLSETSKALSGLVSIVKLSMIDCGDTEEKAVHAENSTVLKGCIVNLKNAAEICRGKKGAIDLDGGSGDDLARYTQVHQLNDEIVKTIERISEYYLSETNEG